MGVFLFFAGFLIVGVFVIAPAGAKQRPKGVRSLLRGRGRLGKNATKYHFWCGLALVFALRKRNKNHILLRRSIKRRLRRLTQGAKRCFCKRIFANGRQQRGGEAAPERRAKPAERKTHLKKTPGWQQ